MATTGFGSSRSTDLPAGSTHEYCERAAALRGMSVKFIFGELRQNLRQKTLERLADFRRKNQM